MSTARTVPILPIRSRRRRKRWIGVEILRFTATDVAVEDALRFFHCMPFSRRLLVYAVYVEFYFKKSVNYVCMLFARHAPNATCTHVVDVTTAVAPH